MAILPLNVGSGPGAGDGEGLRSSQQKVNSNFAVAENAASKIVQASSADTTADKVMLSDYAWRGAQLGDYFTYGGTANAITLTSANLKAGGTLIAGMKFRFKATTTNTGATTISVDGGAATACVTPTGVALPAGFIRTDVVTECEYDGSSFIVSRKVESGSNANGDWTRWEDGTQTCRRTYSQLWPVGGTTVAVAVAATFSDSNYIPIAGWGASTGAAGSGLEKLGVQPISTTSVNVTVVMNSADTRPVYLTITGKWY